MPSFTYQARNQLGEQVSGTREATDQRAALEGLREAGLFVTRLVPAKAERSPAGKKGIGAAPRLESTPPPAEASPADSPLADGERQSPAQSPGTNTAASVPTSPPAAAHRSAPELAPTNMWLTANAKERSLFFRQMHSMLNAGTSVGHSLQTLSKHASNAALRRASLEMATATSSGKPWNEAMKAYPSLFDELSIGMVGAGEHGGFLDRTCMRLSEYAERDYELQQTIKRETWYPKLLVISSILIPSAVPLVLAIYNHGNPLAAWLASVGRPFAVIALLWVSWKAWNRFFPLAARTGPLRVATDYLKLQLPGLRKTTRALATAKFCRAMSALYSSGVGLHRLIDVSAGACGNAAFARSARSTIPQIERGVPLTEAMTSTGWFPGVALQMMHTGELSGNMDTQLDKVADFLEQDAETAIKQAVKLFGILIFLAVSAYIGASVIGQYQGYIGQIEEFSKQ